MGSLLLSASSLWAQSAAQTPPNILIILCDDMGYGDFFNITLLPYDESHFTPYGPGCFGPLWGGSSLAADG